MQESFYNYVSGYENILILGCLESYGARLCNIFSDCGVAKWPGVYNIQEVILEAAKKAIYPKAMLSIKMDNWFGQFWKPVALSQGDYFCSFLSATLHQLISSI